MTMGVWSRAIACWVQGCVLRDVGQFDNLIGLHWRLQRVQLQQANFSPAIIGRARWDYSIMAGTMNDMTEEAEPVEGTWDLQIR